MKSWFYALAVLLTWGTQATANGLSIQPALVIRNELNPQETIMLRLLVQSDTRDLLGVQLKRGGGQAVNIRFDVRGNIIPVAKMKDREIVRLGTVGLDSRLGGSLDVRFLKNGLLDTWGNLKLSVERVGNHWMIFTDRSQGHTEINTLYLYLSKFHERAIGIRMISVWKDLYLLPN